MIMPPARGARKYEMAGFINPNCHSRAMLATERCFLRKTAYVNMAEPFHHPA